jgi:hypothetical protein
VDKLGLGPWQPHVANVIPIRPSILNRSAATGSNPDRSA